MNKQEYLEIVELLAENDNIVQAHKITTSWVHVKWHTEWEFWCDLERIIAKEYKILDSHKFSSELLNRAIHYTRNRNLSYGLRIEIAEKNGCLYYLEINRSDTNMYYLLRISDYENDATCKNKQFNDFAKKGS